MKKKTSLPHPDTHIPGKIYSKNKREHGSLIQSQKSPRLGGVPLLHKWMHISSELTLMYQLNNTCQSPCTTFGERQCIKIKNDIRSKTQCHKHSQTSPHIFHSQNATKLYSYLTSTNMNFITDSTQFIQIEELKLSDEFTFSHLNLVFKLNETS